MSNGFKVTLLVLYVVSAAGVAVVLHLDNARLRHRAAGEASRHAQAEELRRANEQTRALLAGTERDDAGNGRALEDEARRLRSEVAALEEKARERHQARRAQAEADAGALATNRDPETGPTRLENFVDVGQATPADAFQTFVWAAMKGEDERLAGLIVFAGEGRAKAAAIVAGLSAEDRERIPTPESLAALFFADAITTMKGAQVVEVSLTDADHAVVRVRGMTPREQRFPMQRSAAGWQISVPEGLVAKLEGWSRGGVRAAGK